MGLFRDFKETFIVFTTWTPNSDFAVWAAVGISAQLSGLSAISFLWVILWCIINTYLVFVPFSGTELKPLEFRTASELVVMLGEWHVWRGHGSSFPHTSPYTSLPSGCSWVTALTGNLVGKMFSEFSNQTQIGGLWNLVSLAGWLEAQVTT